MGKSLYKDTLSFLIKSSTIEPVGDHRHRLNVLAGMIWSCMQTKSSSLEGLSQPRKEDDRQSESLVKQAKRWISTSWTDWDSFFAPYATRMLSSLSQKGELVLVVDGSTTGSGCKALMLSVIWKGYAIPLAWLVKKGGKGHFPESMHLELVNCVKGILPTGCRVVLLGDGEFDGTQLRAACKGFGWEFVLRTACDRQVDCGGEMARFDSLCPMPGSETVFLEGACEGDNAVFWHGEGFESPIYLLTNMELGEMACEYYRRRFKIETMFKQFKSAGFQIQKCRVECPIRVKNLLIVVAFAFIFTFCIGILLKQADAATLARFTRKDRIKDMRPITLGQKCISRAKKIAKRLFADFLENWTTIFT